VPQRTHEHVIGDQAMAAVAAVVTEAGHAAERVVNDYGEDLLIQTSHAGRMDASRLWFQVKGTDAVDRYRLKRGGFSVSVDLDHALRWSRSADLVVVVLWDVGGGCGWYAIPGNQMDPRQGLTLGKRSKVLQFSEEQVLDAAAIDRLVWESRINHYRLLVLSARNKEELLETDDDQPPSRLEERVLLGIDFLMLLDLVGIKASAAEEVFQLSDRAAVAFARSVEEEFQAGEELENAIYGAAIKTLLHRTAEIEEGMGLPMALIEDGADTLVAASGLLDWLAAERQADR
jgi:hypothetical protein